MADLAAFFPRSVCDLIEPASAGRKAYKRAPGTVLFCDVAGFTVLTEALSVLGREGAEELTRILNAYFSRMIGIVEEEGGDVLRFGGDAMTVFFPADDGEHAGRAAWRMLSSMGEFGSLPTRAGTFGLTMKMGASRGEVLLGILGDSKAGRDFYAAGPPLDEAAEAEHGASPGSAILHHAFLKTLPKGLHIEPSGHGFARLAGASGSRLRGLPVLPTSSAEAAARLVPPYLQEFATREMSGEHRGTAVLFMAISGLAFEGGDEAAHDKLQALFSLLSSSAARYGGVLNKLDMGDKGTKALLLFGSPRAIEDREEMALRCALDLLHSSDLPAGLSLKMGLASAPVFAGSLGSPTRREYTVMGHAVNKAARFMQAAHHQQLLCDENCRRDAASVFGFTTLPPLLLKGFSESVPAFEPLGEREEESRAAEILVEREEAKAVLEECLLEGRGGATALVSEAGLGKTALVEWAAASARAQDLPVVRVPLGTYSAHRPFSAWRGPLRAMIGVERGDSPERVREARDRALASEPAGHRMLLNPLLDLPEEATPALKNLSPKERNDLTFAILARLLAASGAHAIILDNLHAADPLSIGFLAFLLESGGETPARIVVTLRPGNPAADALTEQMRAVPIKPLTPSGVRTVLAEAFGFTDVEKDVLDWAMSRSKGNPALLRAVVSALQSQGLVLKSPAGSRIDADRLFASSFPETLEGLYLAPVDALPVIEKQVLQHASVLGYDVSRNLLDSLCDVEAAQLDAACASLVKRNLLQQDSWGARPYYRFADGLLRDAVYSALPFSIKRLDHLKLAAYLEVRGRDEPKLWGSLALHYEAGGEEGSALKYHRLAGRDAVRRYDNLTALRHLEPVCARVSSAQDDIDDAFSLLDVYWTLGKPDDTATLIDRLKPLKTAISLQQRARFSNFMARGAARAGDWKEAEKQLFIGIGLSKQAQDVVGQGKAYVNLVGLVYGPTGQLDKAKECLEKALALPSGPGQAVWRTTAGMNLGAVHKHLGMPHEAERWFLLAYKECIKGRLGPLRGVIADNLCSTLGENGRFSESERWGRRSLLSLEAFAMRGVALMARYNLTLGLLASGRAPEASRVLLSVQSHAISQRNEQILGLTEQGLSSAALQLADLTSAIARAQSALRVFRNLHNGRDYRFTLLGISGVFHALASQTAASDFWCTAEAETFLRESPPDPVADYGLSRIRDWINAGKAPILEAERFLKEAGPVSFEETLERHLWACEMLADHGQSAKAKRGLGDAYKALASWPYFDARLRILRLEAIADGKLSPARRKEAALLLSRCIGGVWGLRLLCTLWAQEEDTRRRQRLRKKALERLSFVKEHSPEWAWEKIQAFPEVHAVLEPPIRTVGPTHWTRKPARRVL